MAASDDFGLETIGAEGAPDLDEGTLAPRDNMGVGEDTLTSVALQDEAAPAPLLSRSVLPRLNDGRGSCGSEYFDDRIEVFGGEEWGRGCIGGDGGGSSAAAAAAAQGGGRHQQEAAAAAASGCCHDERRVSWMDAVRKAHQ